MQTSASYYRKAFFRHLVQLALVVQMLDSAIHWIQSLSSG